MEKLIEKVLNLCLNYGCDFAEIYYETKSSKTYNLINSKIDNIYTSNSNGIGLRIKIKDNIYYYSTNKFGEEEILSLVKNLIKNIGLKKVNKKKFKLEKKEEKKFNPKLSHSSFSEEKKVSLLKEIDKYARKESKYIIQVMARLVEDDKEFLVANTNGTYISSNEISTRVLCIPTTEYKDKKEDTFGSYGKSMGYEMFENFDLKSFATNLAKISEKKLFAKKFKGGTYPVVIGSGFGAVIFHEACGHALEATCVSDGQSAFSNMLGKKIASDKVTLIDDGTLKDEWGTTFYDSEGNKTQKNILIENGILKSYLVDTINTEKMKHLSTSSGRRESYLYPPTSRMNNTYLARGTDKIEDMIKSIEYGVYCKSLIGGSVNTTTGDFNFSADESYIIENGRITDMITGITLIGKGQDILKNVEMVSDDLKIDTGYCGSTSGTIKVTIGQPTIKVKEILIGGTE